MRILRAPEVMTAFGKCPLWHKPGFKQGFKQDCIWPCFRATFQWPHRGTVSVFFQLLSIPTPCYMLKLNSGFRGYCLGKIKENLSRKFKIGYPCGFLWRLWQSSWALSSVPRHTCRSPPPSRLPVVWPQLPGKKKALLGKEIQMACFGRLPYN